MGDQFFSGSDRESLSRILEAVGVESRIIVLVSSDLRITNLTSAAQTLFSQGVLSPLAQLLSDNTVTALRLCIATKTTATLSEELDGTTYDLEVQPLHGGGLLLYFHTGDRFVSADALSEFVSERTDAALATIFLATRKLESNPSPEAARALTGAIRKCSLRIHRTLSHAQSLTAAPGVLAADLQIDDAAALLKEIYQKVQDRARGNVAVRIESPKECIAVFDRDLIAQALYNLVANAMSADHVCTLCLRLTRGPSQITFSVLDDGVGLPPEALSHLYDGWRTSRTAEQLLADAAAGVRWGLGLPLAHRIAGLHSGVLLMRPNEPRGTIFSLTFPDDLSPLISFRQPPIHIEDGFDSAEVELSALPYS